MKFNFKDAEGFALVGMLVVIAVMTILAVLLLPALSQAKPRPGDDEHGVLPGIPATGQQLRPYRGEADPVLAFTINHIKQTRDKK